MTYDISKELVRRGHEVTVFTTDAYDAKSRLVYERNPVHMDGFTVYHFRNLSNHLAHKNLSIAPTMGFALRKHIESLDLIHIREYFSVQTVLAHHYATKKVFLTLCKLTVRSRGSPGRNLEAALRTRTTQKRFLISWLGIRC